MSEVLNNGRKWPENDNNSDREISQVVREGCLVQASYVIMHALDTHSSLFE